MWTLRQTMTLDNYIYPRFQDLILTDFQILLNQILKVYRKL